MKKVFSFLLMFIFLSAQSQVVLNMKKVGGVYEVPCKVNGLNLSFIFDTGASDVSISLIEALFMIRHGYLKEENILGKVQYSIANGDIAEGTRILLKDVEIGGLKLTNVEASIVHEMEAPLLLGQSVIQKLGKIMIDGDKLTIINAENKITSGSSVLGSFTDMRDGREYKTTKIGNQIWMAENLAFEAESTKSFKYNNNPIISGNWGFLYTAYMANNVCPKGWKLPSKDDWMTLLNFTADTKITSSSHGLSSSEKSNIGIKLKSDLIKVNGYNKIKGTNDYNFSSLPAGYGSSRGDRDMHEYTSHYWSSTAFENNTTWSFWIDLSFEGFFSGPDDDKVGKSVRCIKE